MTSRRRFAASVSNDGELAKHFLHNLRQKRLTHAFFAGLGEAIAEIGRSGAGAALLSAEGSDFSCRGDLVPWPELSPLELRVAFEQRLATVNQWESLAIPTVVAVQGLCFGGGFELAVRSDVVFAGETARFGHPEQSLGIVTMLGGIYRVTEPAGKGD
jgi:enoyl-CoA hydratase/carnithine racemase